MGEGRNTVDQEGGKREGGRKNLKIQSREIKYGKKEGKGKEGSKK